MTIFGRIHTRHETQLEHDEASGKLSTGGMNSRLGLVIKVLYGIQV